MSAEETEEAPGGLETLRLFVNTWDYPNGADRLASQPEAAQWCRERGLPPPANQRESERLRAFREVVRDALFANNGEGDAGAALAGLSAFAQTSRFSMTFVPGKGPLLQARSDSDATIAALLAIVYEAMSEGTWPRLRACRKETCKFAYYDRSKNASRAWCSMAVCGNREKAHRRRLRDRAL
jgi:predicted RNA-binding Zn ribbon-like protein